ncbi:MAG: flagellar export chaperone FliS [Alteromonadaceae bacterium]|nr:flagellar export chaperone FliS [Alteromonadaceae bacterium]
MALKGIQAYKKGSLKQDLSTADPHKITLMLMQGALEKIAYAKGAMERREYESKAQHVSKAIAIIVSLRDTLDMDIGGELAENLFSLYDYMVTRLNDGNIQNNEKILDEVIQLMLPIKNAWMQIPESAKQEAYEMKKQQSVASV